MTQLATHTSQLRTSTVGQVRAVAAGLAFLVIGCVAAVYFAAVRTEAPPLLTAGIVLMAGLVGAQGVRTDCGWNAGVRLVIPGTHRPSAVLAAHVAGILVGSAVTAGAATLLALAFPDFGAVWLGVPFLLIGGLRLLRPTTILPGGWKVRRVWEHWGALRYMAVFGFFLGLGFVTTIASPSFLLMATWGLQSANILVPFATFAGFAAGRIATTLISAAGDAKVSSVVCRAVDNVRARIAPLGRIEGGIGVVIGVCLLLGVSA